MNETYKNYFGRKTAAERYAKGRPRFHAFVIERIKKYLALREPLSCALDAGCGTGLSSVALRDISERVVGVDISAEMLRQAPEISGLEYVLASAENLPFDTCEFDLITISQAIHWLDKRKFFAEADRVLKPGAPLIAYDNYFQGKILGEPAFNEWYTAEFLKNYPVPPRGARTFEKQNEQNFVLDHEELNDNIIEFSAPEMVDYLVTITNVIARVENGSQTIGEVNEWLTKSVAPFFGGSRKPFVFVNPIWFLRRKAVD